MDYDYFQRYMLGFVNGVIQQLDVDTGRTRVAVISFSDRAQVRQSTTVIDFNQSINQSFLIPLGVSFPWVESKKVKIKAGVTIGPERRRSRMCRAEDQS